jgi:hypothetical protein
VELAKPGKRKKSAHKENGNVELENPGNRSNELTKRRKAWK